MGIANSVIRNKETKFCSDLGVILGSHDNQVHNDKYVSGRRVPQHIGDPGGPEAGPGEHPHSDDQAARAGGECTVRAEQV